MFLALREIRAARGRFALMAGVVAMITLLLVVLTALTNGLGHQSTSAVEALPAQRVVLAPTSGKATYGESRLSDEQARAWTAAPGATARPLGIGHTRVERGTDAASVAVMATPAVAVGAGQVVLPRETAGAFGVAPGGTVSIGGADLTVVRVEDTQWYSHSPVAWVAPATFETLTHQPARTALLVDGVSDDAATALDSRVGTASMTPADSVAALPGYSSEHGSLLLIQAFLYGICALVVVAFVSVWTVQRTRELAIVRALGGSRRYVLRDALGQAAVVLAVGVALGTALAAGLVAGIASAAPVLAGLTTFGLPVAGILGLGLAGSFAATRRVTHVDPLLALGGN